MVRIATLLLCLVTAGVAPAAANPDLPVPALLEPNVAFWTRIYTEVDTGGGLIHDSVEMDVVYETVTFPKGLSRRSREHRVEARKKQYRAILGTLASGKRSGLSAEEARVLGLWPAGVSNQTLKKAKSHLRFQRGQADKYRDGLVRSGQWTPFIAEVLAEHGVPGELTALPHVESSFNPHAYSRVGAAGMWQFTRSTGRLYMRVDNVVDERMDPQKASVAAARLLRDNFRRLESWPLAITAYNHGVGGMARAVRKTGTRDFGVIAREYKGRTFGFASRNFYASFLAASHVHQNHERYFGHVNRQAPMAYDTLVTDAYYTVPTLTRALGIDADVLREHNLALRPAVWNGAKRVPKGYALWVPRHALELPVDAVLAQIPAAERLAEQTRDRYHKVRRGDTLSKIASRYRTSERELVRMNNLRSRHRIRVGQVLRLPTDGNAPLEVARAKPPSDGVYRVRRGDNLSIIAARFGVGMQDLVRWNRLRNRHRLSIGQRLRVAPELQVASAEQASASDATLVATAPVAPAPEPVVTPPEPVQTAALAPTPPESNGHPEPAVEVESKAEPQPEVEIEIEAETELPPEVAPPVLAAEEPAEPELPESASVVAVAPVAEGAVPDPSNYAVTSGSRVIVQADETLGHYAEWLEVSAARLRRLNKMGYKTPLVIGRRKKLDFSRVTPEVFERRRLDYHRTLQEEFFSAWTVTGTTDHVIRRGDSLWYLANRKFAVPLWLLRQYNPDVDFGALPAGTPLVVPVVEARDELRGGTTPASLPQT